MKQRNAHESQPETITGRSSAASGPLVPPPGSVTVRMYRQGLGDCFLLAFGGSAKGDVVYLLIDCGVHISQPRGRQIIRQVVDDIVLATGGHLNVLVVTHEHADHLSAFKYEAARLLDRQLKIDHLWLAWTEDERDKLAATTAREPRHDPEGHRVRSGTPETRLAIGQYRTAVDGPVKFGAVILCPGSG